MKIAYKFLIAICSILICMCLLLCIVSPVSGVFIIILSVLSIILSKKKLKELGNNSQKSNVSPKESASMTPEEPPVSSHPSIPSRIHHTYKVSGVTFKTGRKSRQVALRHIYFRDPPYDGDLNVYIQQYDYDGEIAIGVYVNDFQVGNIPKNKVNEILDMWDDDMTLIDYSIYGGGDGKSWGMEIELSFKNPKFLEESIEVPISTEQFTK